MLLARGFSYADAHRARLGVNYKQIPVNAPKVEVHSYSKDGAMRIRNATDPVYAPNSCGGPHGQTRSARPRRTGMPTARWSAPRTRCAPDDDDWGQAGTLVRDVMDDAARERLVSNVAGHLRNGVSVKVLERACDYWKNIDKETGDKIEAAVRNGSS